MGSSICSLTTLTELSLPWCNLTAIDPAIIDLVNLVGLNLNHNQFFPEVCHPRVRWAKPSLSSLLNTWVAYMQVPQGLARLPP